ncbi:fibronectin type III domain-containing protein 7-like [Salvelinus fontinalis]|uniref:fibronectin type III domain-containing protein 7-like n=1 Tax=Salvelinus fontinalis TaxID=8038 RepID=UPI002485F7DE|nr:fibronectin type III domain-containing protein 7-like [Salvelinus fontinalis]
MGCINSLTPNIVYIIKAELLRCPLQTWQHESRVRAVEFTEVTGASYYILRAENTDLSFSETEVSSSPGTVLNLQAYTDYTLSVISVIHGGRSQPSLPSVAKTAVAAPELNSTSPSNDTIVSNNTCTPPLGGNTCCVLEIMCEDIYKVVLAPLTWDGAIVQFCPQRMYSVEYSCTSGRAMVSWARVFGADSYRAVATGSGRTVLSCTSQGTECQITGVGCGEDYMVQVTAVSKSCESKVNATSHFVTVPCPPKNLNLYRECSSNVIIFSWAATNNTAHYRAKAVDSEGENMDCMTLDTSCFFTNTVCGRRYTFTVYSVSSECNSQASPPVAVRTANCRSEVLTSTWDRAEGALAYTVEAWGNKDESNRYNCSSFTNSCAIPSVHCGESLTMYITAFDDNCPSYRTLGRVAETVPCAPQNVSAAMYCGSDSITLNWQVSYGSLFYIATAMDDAGVVHTCNSMDTKCQIKGLRCSSTYNAFVTATNLKCNSSDSEIVTVETAPCLPDHIEAFLNCAANHALIVWQGHHSILSYTATIEDTEGGLLSCSTTGNNCTVPSLKCGQLYSVSVMHHDGICPSIPSQAITMESVPCGPANVQTEMDCGSGTLTVSWDTSLSALGYTTIISHGNREQVTCNSTATSCSVDTLDCGEEYVVEVMSVNRSCLSMPSQAMVIREVPCVPTNVTAHRTCGESPVAVTWDASRGAKIYTAIAMGNSGHRTECTSNDTTCSLEDLLCGQTYSLSVLAVDDACSSTESSMVTLETDKHMPKGKWT